MTITPCLSAINETCRAFHYPTSAEGDSVVLSGLGGGNFAVDWLPPTFGPGDRARTVVRNRAPEMALAAPFFSIHRMAMETDGVEHVAFDGSVAETLNSCWEMISEIGHKDDPLSAYKWAGGVHGFINPLAADVYPNGLGPGRFNLAAGESLRLASVSFYSRLELMIPSRGTKAAMLELSHVFSRDGFTGLWNLEWTDPDARSRNIYGLLLPTTYPNLAIVNGTSVDLPCPGETPNLGPAGVAQVRWATAPGLALRMHLPAGSGPAGWAEAQLQQSFVRARKLHFLRVSRETPGVPQSGLSQARYQFERV
jgi:hypothetical protein